jgi:MoaA/NifB/PqqE/SkfB family radical SAM enzyme
MECGHCGFSCTAEGDDMTLETARIAIVHFESDGLTIGGGEPTIHPAFWELFGLCVGSSDYLFMVTNGKETEKALALARLAERGVLSCDLSIDPYHEPIDDRVYEAFKKRSSEFYTRFGKDGRGIRDTSNNIVSVGRAWNWGYEEGCICEDLFITPKGDVKPCGCEDSPILGNVNDPAFDSDVYYEYCGDFIGECFENRTELLEANTEEG